MEFSVPRGAGAALLLILGYSGPALAQRGPAPTAIAAGLAIPVGPPAEYRPAIPAGGRFVLVDAASARLFMIENGEVVDSMRVIVGKPEAATPVIRSTLHYATLNPYWNVPPDLASRIIAPRVLKEGPGYLSQRGYQVVSAFTGDPGVLDPADVDWDAVAAGRARVYVRQLPGPANSMGQIKFGFANDDGIFLHDTPRKELFNEAERNLSNGCVRLEDANRFARWLLGRDANVPGQEAEQHVPLPRPVPIMIAYLEDGASLELAAAN